jgi:hypothetical protein
MRLTCNWKFRCTNDKMANELSYPFALVIIGVLKYNQQFRKFRYRVAIKEEITAQKNHTHEMSLT